MDTNAVKTPRNRDYKILSLVQVTAMFFMNHKTLLAEKITSKDHVMQFVTMTSPSDSHVKTFHVESV